MKVGEELRHALAWALERGEVHDPLVAAQPLTVTEVSVSPDLKNATAYVVPLGGRGADLEPVLAGLNRARPFLRRLLAERQVIFFRDQTLPNITFAADTALENAGCINDLLHRPDVARDLGPVPGAGEETKDGT